MHKITTIFVSLLFAAFVPESGAASVIDDFARVDAEITALRGDAITIEKIDGRNALSLAWGAAHDYWIENVYKTPRAIPEFAAKPDTSYCIKMDARIPAGVAQIGVRLIDTRHEVHQWIRNLTPPDSATPDAWREISIPVDFEKSAGHWAGNNDGVVDFPARLLGFSIAFASKEIPAGRVLISNLRTEALATVALETDRFPYIVNATGDTRFGFAIRNPHDKPLDVEIAGTATDFYGKSVNIRARGRVSANDTARIPAALSRRNHGFNTLDCNVTIDGVSTTFKNTFVVADPVVPSRKKGDFLFGICSHTERHPDDVHEKEIVAAKEAGATVLRIGPAWAALEPKPGEWNWAVQDRLVALAAKHGIETQPILGYGPAHAALPALRAAQAEAYKAGNADAWRITLFGTPEEAAWRNYVREFATRYKGKIQLYEVWNEPDLGFWRGTTDEYIRILRAAREELRRADPDALLMTGGFATVLAHQGRAKNPDLQERVLAEASDAFDIHAFHQHGTFAEFCDAVDGELARLRAKMKTPRPLYFNETALTSTHFGERTQAVTLVKKIVFAMARGAIGYTWYDLRNDGTNPADHEHNYGLVDIAFRPKPAYAAFMETARRLHGAKFARALDLGAGNCVYLFKTPRGHTLVSWNENAATSGELFFIRTPNALADVNAFDVMGGKTALPTIDGVAVFRIEKEPRFIEILSNAKPEIMSLLYVEAPTFATPHESVRATIQIRNPFKRMLNVTFLYQSLNGKPGTSLLEGKPMTLGHGASEYGIVSAGLLFSAPDGTQPQHAMKLDYSVAEIPTLNGTVALSVPVVRTIESAAIPDSRAPDWTLDKRSDYFSFCDADPALKDFVWQSPGDLSAKVWAWHDGENLRLRVDVRDDKHVQNETPEMMWKGDSVQLAIVPPGVSEPIEIGAAMNDAGEILKHVWTLPRGMTLTPDDFRAVCKKIDNGVRYELALPFEKFGLTESARRDGFRFNLIVNDNDGTLREGFMRIAPGLGESKNPSAYPMLRMKP